MMVALYCCALRDGAFYLCGSHALCLWHDDIVMNDMTLHYY